MGLATRRKDLAVLTLDQLPDRCSQWRTPTRRRQLAEAPNSRTPWTKQSQELPHRSAEEGTCFRLQGLLHGHTEGPDPSRSFVPGLKSDIAYATALTLD